jgi:hypothetical protein
MAAGFALSACDHIAGIDWAEAVSKLGGEHNSSSFTCLDRRSRYLVHNMPWKTGRSGSDKCDDEK